MAVALAADFDFVRVEGFVYGHVADEGWIDACAGELLRYRTQISAEGEAISIWADIKKKHSAHAVTADVSLAETAQAATYNLCDALIVSGSHTAEAANPNDLKAVRAISPEIPVYIGSGITAENVGDYRDATGFIVGSSLKEDGHWENPLCADRVEAMVQAARSL
jgi:membrane complex biogenesis BtpA family protein